MPVFSFRKIMKNNPYKILGLSFVLAGAIFAPVSYFVIASVTLTSIGISLIILGFVCLMLANTRPYISPEASQMMLRTGMENTSALLEELGLRNKAIYLPSALRDGRPQAIIPLTNDGNIFRVKEKLSGRLIVRYGAGSDDLAIAVTTPGSMNIDMLEDKPGPTAEEIETAATYILVGLLDIASAISVRMLDEHIEIDIKAPKLGYENIWYYRTLGSPLASIVAAISCEALNKPIRVSKESYEDDKGTIELEVLS